MQRQNAANVSLLAFLQELSNWEMTLSREAKKLKQLRQTCSNKLKLNTIDIILIEIESQLIQYKKAKDKKSADTQAIIQQYTILSRRFINLIEKIGEAQGEDNKNTNNDTLILDHTDIADSIENVCPNIGENRLQKRFLDQTFSYTVSKQPKKKSQMHKKLSIKQTACNLYPSALNSKNKSQLTSVNKSKNQNKKKYSTTLQQLESQQQKDLWDIRYQLRQIKSMMTQMGNQIKYHNHQQIEKQINKIEHNNKKLSLQLKSLKEDNQFMLSRLQNIKQDIAQQKKAQVQMIKQFQQGRDHSRSNFQQLSKSKQNLTQEYIFC